MVMDFEDIKSVIGRWIQKNLDHRMILYRKDSYVAVLKKRREPLFLTEGSPTAENLARLIYDYAKKRALPVHSVTLWETESSSATYTGEA